MEISACKLSVPLADDVIQLKSDGLKNSEERFSVTLSDGTYLDLGISEVPGIAQTVTRTARTVVSLLPRSFRRYVCRWVSHSLLAGSENWLGLLVAAACYQLTPDVIRIKGDNFDSLIVIYYRLRRMDSGEELIPQESIVYVRQVKGPGDWKLAFRSPEDTLDFVIKSVSQLRLAN